MNRSHTEGPQKKGRGSFSTKGSSLSKGHKGGVAAEKCREENLKMLRTRILSMIHVITQKLCRGITWS